jgi:hypothetical protein
MGRLHDTMGSVRPRWDKKAVHCTLSYTCIVIYVDHLAWPLVGGALLAVSIYVDHLAWPVVDGALLVVAK